MCYWFGNIVLTQKVDLTKLDMAALLRYWRHFNLVSSKETILCYWLLWKRVFCFLQQVIHWSLFRIGGCSSESHKGATNWHYSETLHVSGRHQSYDMFVNVVFWFWISLRHVLVYSKWMSFRLLWDSFRLQQEWRRLAKWKTKEARNTDP